MCASGGNDVLKDRGDPKQPRPASGWCDEAEVSKELEITCDTPTDMLADDDDDDDEDEDDRHNDNALEASITKRKDTHLQTYIRTIYIYRYADSTLNPASD